MGSLMAGWDSEVFRDPDTVKLQRNKSMTKEEIQSFWKGKKLQVECEEPKGEEPMKSPTSTLSPVFKFKKGSGMDSPSGGEKGTTSRIIADWWTKSNWAFLNEPPEEDKMSESEHKYAAQFHVAAMSPSTAA